LGKTEGAVIILGKRIVVTGQSGTDKKEYLERVVRQEYLNKTKRQKMKLFNIGDAMYQEAENAGGKIMSGRILDVSLLRLNSLRRLVFKDIIRYYESNPDANILVNTHSCFRWQYGLFNALDIDLIHTLDPNMYITLIDDVDSIYLRLKQKEEGGPSFSLKDILVWREEEIITTEMIALVQGKPFYILPRKNPIDTIAKLAFGDQLKKAYLSFPITKVRDKEAVLEKIRSFKNMMANKLIIFDPITIGEKRLLLFSEEDIKTGTMSVETLGEEIEFPVSDLKSVAKDIDGQIISRDYRLINQSDIVVAFIPETKGNPDISAGVQTEIHYAHDLPREVYVIWESNRRPSVWVEQMATKVFQGEKAFESCTLYFEEKGYFGGLE